MNNPLFWQSSFDREKIDIKKTVSWQRVIRKSAFRKVLILALCFLTSCSSIDSKNTADAKNQANKPGFRQAQAMAVSGDVESSLSLMQNLLKAEPNNIEYRTYWISLRSQQMNLWMKQADEARANQDWGAAQSLYEKILATEPQQNRAKEGLRKIEAAKEQEVLLTNAKELVQKSELDSAMQLINKVLTEAPSNKAARLMYEQVEHLRTSNLLMPPKLKAALKKTVTMEFKEIPIKSIFEFISKASKINFTYDQTLSNDLRTSIYVRDTTIEEVIKLVLTTNQLEKKVLNDNTLLIYPQNRSAEYQELYARSFYLTNIDAKRALNLVKTMVKTKDIVIDEKLNTLLMRDTPEAISVAEKLIMSQDLSEPEVMMEVEILEVNRKSLEAIGIRYPTQVSLGVRGLANTALDGSATYTAGQLSLAELKHFNSNLGVFSITDPVLALDFLNQDTDTNLLANPQIRVKNKEKAKILIGDKIPVITNTANSTGFVSENVTYLDVGIKLDVEPTILLNDEVSIKVALEVSNQTDQIKSSTGSITYSIGTRNASTVLRLKNNETQVLAGLFRDDEQNVVNKVPGLSSLPFFGKLFTDKSKDKRKKEIVLLITPRIISNVVPPDVSLTFFPVGKDSSTANRNPRSIENTVVNNQPIVPPVKTQQDIQTDRVRVDKSFLDSLTQPTATPTSEPDVDKTPAR